LSLNVTKFFRASRPVHRASRFKASLKILFICYFEVSNNVWVSIWSKKNIPNSNNIKKNVKQNYEYFNTWFNRHTDGKMHLNTINFKFIANFTNHTLGILKPKCCSLGLRAGHYWPWISVYFEGIAANKQGIDGQWPPLNLRPALPF
jgi:hypothetical protein